MPFTALAQLATRAGAERLRDAGFAVSDQVPAGSSSPLTDCEVEWVARLAQGVRVIDLANDVGYCERAMYRNLRLIWTKLGVSSREEGITLAVREGWV